MFKAEVYLEVKGQDERVYKLECKPNSPLGEIYDALNEMRSVTIKLMQEHSNQENEKKQKSEEENPQEENQEEVKDAEQEGAEPS